MERFSEKCPNCSDHMKVKHLFCPSCDIKIEGSMELPNLAKLTPDDREFIELFVVSGGSIKEVGQLLGISYPTVRAKLDQVITTLKTMRSKHEEQRLSILDRLARGEITAKEAAALLRGQPVENPSTNS